MSCCKGVEWSTWFLACDTQPGPDSCWVQVCHYPHISTIIMFFPQAFHPTMYYNVAVQSSYEDFCLPMWLGDTLYKLFLFKHTPTVCELNWNRKLYVLLLLFWLRLLFNWERIMLLPVLVSAWTSLGQLHFGSCLIIPEPIQSDVTVIGSPFGSGLFLLKINSSTLCNGGFTTDLFLIRPKRLICLLDADFLWTFTW